MSMQVPIIITVVVTCVSLPIFLGLFFGIVYPDVEDINNSQMAHCTTKAFTINSSPCCDRSDCKCNECYDHSSCDDALNSHTPGVCCGGYDCCYFACDTCYRTETYECSCQTVNNIHSCSTCTRTVPYSCNCYCRISVSHETCTVYCGTCYDLTAIININISSYTHTERQQCGRDQAGCVQDFERSWNVTLKKCWWDSEDNEIYWEQPSHDVAALVFTIFFGITTLLGPLGLLGYWLVVEKFQLVQRPSFQPRSTDIS